MNEHILALEREELDKKKRPERADRLIKFLRRTNAYEFVRNILEVKEDIPNFEEFKAFINRIHGIAKEIPASQRRFDGENVHLSGFIRDVAVLKHEDKEDVLKYLYDSLEKIDKDDLKYAIPVIINALHLYSDGNGRTSRVFYQLLNSHSSEEQLFDELKKALGKDGRYDTPDISPGLITTDIRTAVLENHGWIFGDARWTPYRNDGIKHLATPDFRHVDKNIMTIRYVEDLREKCKDDIFYTTTAVIESLSSEKIKKLITDKYEVKGLLSPLKMAEELSEDEWKKIIEKYYDLKKEDAKVFVDMFIDKNSYHPWRDKDTSLRDRFIDEVRANYEKNISD